MFRGISLTALDLLADGAARPEQAVEVLLAVELPELGEAGVGEGGAAGGALEAVLVQGAVSHPQHVLVFYLSVALCTDLHIRHCLQLHRAAAQAGLQYQLQLLCSAAGLTAAAGEGLITPSSDSRVAAERRPATRARPPRHPPATRSTAGAVRRGRPSAALSADRCPQPPRTRRRARV